MADIINKELSYEITGIAYKIHNALGSIYSEKQYQDVFEETLKSKNLSNEREKDLYFKVGDSRIKGNRPDFIIENKIVVDLKVKKYIAREDFRQMLRYLKSGEYKLGLIINFGTPRVVIKRVVNSGPVPNS